jgi:hypothetical protein
LQVRIPLATKIVTAYRSHGMSGGEAMTPFIGCQPLQSIRLRVIILNTFSGERTMCTPEASRDGSSQGRLIPNAILFSVISMAAVLLLSFAANVQNASDRAH